MNTMQTKTEKVKKLISENKIKEAIAILKTFRIMKPGEIRALQIVHECSNGSEGFYKSIGVDLESEKVIVSQVINRYK